MNIAYRELQVTIDRASSSDAAVLTAIAFSAKRQWGYPERWIEGWRKSLTITPQFVAAHETYAAFLDDRIVGFHALYPRDHLLWLEHLWVQPEAQRQGIGRALFQHALKKASNLGFPALEIESDPNAEGFYARMGAERVGVRSIAKQARELPLLHCAITSGLPHPGKGLCP